MSIAILNMAMTSKPTELFVVVCCAVQNEGEELRIKTKHPTGKVNVTKKRKLILKNAKKKEKFQRSKTSEAFSQQEAPPPPHEGNRRRDEGLSIKTSVQ